jgi:hypothetical protein
MRERDSPSAHTGSKHPTKGETNAAKDSYDERIHQLAAGDRG